MMTSFDNNEKKDYLFLKDDIGGPRVRSCIRSYDLRFYNHGVTIAFFFGVSSDKQMIFKKLFATR